MDTQWIVLLVNKFKLIGLLQLMRLFTIRYFTLSLLLILSYYAQAQQTRSQKLDSLYNDPFFYSTVSAIILPKGFVEINNFGSLFTANQLFTSQSERADLNARLNQFVNILQVTYGTSATSRFNIGVDLQYSASHLALDPASSPLKVFSSDSAYFRQKAFSHAGVHFRWKPFSRNRRLLVQGSIYQPIDKPDQNQTSLRLQVIQVWELSRRLFLYTQPGVTYNIPKGLIGGSVSIPLTALVQFQLKPRLGILGILSHSISMSKNAESSFSQTSWGSQIGAGLQFQPTLRIGFTGFVTQYLAGKNIGVYRTANVGMRVII